MLRRITPSPIDDKEKGITIAYTSVYGNTKKAVELLKDKLEKEVY